MPPLLYRSQWQSLVKKLEKDGLLPVVVFSFSKKKCQECADGLRNVTLTNARWVSRADSVPNIN